jgi:hypothetical protein
MLGDSLPNQYGLGFSVHTARGNRADGCLLLGVQRTLTRRSATAALRSGQFSLKRACDSSMPSLDNAFCGVGVAIDDLKVGKPQKSSSFGHGESRFSPQPQSFFTPVLDAIHICLIAPDTLAATSARGGAPMRAGRSHRRSDPDGSRPRHGVSRGARRGSGWCSPKRR